MTKAFKLNWHIPVPTPLQEGALTDRWTEDAYETDCNVRVDDCGFFIYWKSEKCEGDVLELSQVNDIRSTKPHSVSNVYWIICFDYTHHSLRFLGLQLNPEAEAWG